MVYVNFHKPMCPRTFLEGVGVWPGGNRLLPNSADMAWNFQTLFYKIAVGSLKVVYAKFQKPIFPRDFSVITKLLKSIYAIANIFG